MTAPPTSPSEVQKTLAAITSLAILASSLPTTEVRASLERERLEALRTGTPCPPTLGILIDIVDQCAFLGRLGGDLEAAIEEARPGR